jgi:hypothetical protein
VPLTESFAAALPALTSLRASTSSTPDVSGLTGLRRLELRAEAVYDRESCKSVVGLSALTALEDLRLACDLGLFAQPSDLAPLSALTRLAMTGLPLELASHPLAARLRRLELQAFDELYGAPEGAAAAAFAALARGATLLERLVVRVDHGYDWESMCGQLLLRDHPEGVILGDPLGAGVAWPSLTHLEVTAWAAVLLAGCDFPRLSRLVANVFEGDGDFEAEGYEIPSKQLRRAVAALAAKARDHAALRVLNVRKGVFHATHALAATAAPVSLRHLSWRCWAWRGGGPAAPPGDWARLAASLESLELVGPLPAFGYAEPLAALMGLTRLHLNAEAVRNSKDGERPPQGAGVAREGDEPPRGLAGGAFVRTARALARLPRLAHLRLTFRSFNVSPERPEVETEWGSALVAAELARCPALRLLEVGRPHDPLWRHELGDTGANPRTPRPSPSWPPFAEALRAGGCRATVRPAPAWTGPSVFSNEFDLEC